jgi:hypothetical protein
LLAHAQTRLASLLHEVNLAVAALQPGGIQNGAIAKLARLVDEANDNLAALDVSLHKPVDNAHLASGEIELF